MDKYPYTVLPPKEVLANPIYAIKEKAKEIRQKALRKRIGKNRTLLKSAISPIGKRLY